MFWRIKSKEVTELGLDILRNYEDISITLSLADTTDLIIFKFKSVILITVHKKEEKLIKIKTELKLTRKEVYYLHNCLYRGYMKQLTFLPNTKT